MKGGPAALVLLAIPLAGCLNVGAPHTESPLEHPKLLLASTFDARVEIYVHSAFGDLKYDWLNLTLDNETTLALNDTYALDNKTNLTTFHLRVDAVRDEGSFYYEFDFALNASRVSARVTPYREGEPVLRDAREQALPFEKLLERVEDSAPGRDGEASA